MKVLVELVAMLRALLRGTTTIHRDSAAAATSPTATRPRRTPSSPQIRRTAYQIYVVALLLANVGMVYVGGELLDLYVSAVELWAELARKHLELTL